MPRYCPRCGEALHSHSTTKGEVRKTARRAYESPESPKPKRKPSAANAAYSRAFAKVKGRYQKKNGQWKKGGFGKAVRAAHKLAKK